MSRLETRRFDLKHVPVVLENVGDGGALQFFQTMQCAEKNPIRSGADNIDDLVGSCQRGETPAVFAPRVEVFIDDGQHLPVVDREVTDSTLRQSCQPVENPRWRIQIHAEDVGGGRGPELPIPIDGHPIDVPGGEAFLFSEFLQQAPIAAHDQNSLAVGGEGEASVAEVCDRHQGCLCDELIGFVVDRPQAARSPPHQATTRYQQPVVFAALNPKDATVVQFARGNHQFRAVCAHRHHSGRFVMHVDGAVGSARE